MKRDLMEILACPMCKGDLDLEVFEEKDGEILKGKLCCKGCGESYPIEDGIPNMLPPELREEMAR
ncbi:methytransferase partner Trm112 [Methanotrichaceae archaeon M04Ac]|uniref:Methytransferase partner Trm112 n=1 Tax=Candidatus Methanocrinis alkalitolerans TaxID=3033395 RepID=A0ABT5XDX7_9EURY|nr:methytransferase partner Trm112 [Candidatus Methanocrinis alkalitolerans]MCR3882761.1 methytransferase partner Trm112 [Methanothrix sp.]MDF0592913.1 methytransferase partner Trm112 [Candidatus Methanocrinis alkalitolerans]